MEREVLVGTRYSGDEMLLEGSNVPFWWVSAMDVGRYKLKFLIYLPHESFENIRAFIVQDM